MCIRDSVHIDLFQRLVIAPAAVSILSLSPGGMVRVLRLNDDGPLHAPTTPEPTKDKRKRKKKQPAGEPLAEPTPRPTADNGHHTSTVAAHLAALEEEE